MTTKPKRKPNKKANGKKTKRKIANPSPRFAQSVVLHNLNRSPMAASRKMTFNYEFGFSLDTILGQHNNTQLFELQSPWDPDYTNNTRNASVSYWLTFMGATSGKYEKFLVNHCTVEIECYGFTTGQLINCVYSLTTKRELEYPSTTNINQIAQRPMATNVNIRNTGGKGVRKKLVCTPYKVHGIKKSDYTQKITTPNVAGVDGYDTGYFCEHNARSRNGSWLAVSVGSQTVAGVPQPISARFQGRITYHGIAYRPILAI